VSHGKYIDVGRPRAAGGAARELACAALSAGFGPTYADDMPADIKTVLKSVLERLRSIELKLDVLIESQGLGGVIEQREAEEKQRLALRTAETAEQVRDAVRR
jgi:hypothetical protein